MRKRFIIIIVVLVMIVPSAPIFARSDNDIALGVQLGFLATGVVADINIGPISLNAGVNYPIGWTYLSLLTGNVDSTAFPALFSVTADATFPISLSEDFYLKIGASTLGFTDFETGIIGVLGPCIKGEYWIPYRDYALFVNLNVPIMLYGAFGDFIGDSSASGVYFSPYLTLFGLATTAAGILWSF